MSILREKIAPTTKETDARRTRRLPSNLIGSKSPISISGKPIITKAPRRPKIIPRRFIKKTFSFKNHQPKITERMGIIRVITEADVASVLLIPEKKKAIFRVIIKIPTAISLGRCCDFIVTFFLWIKKKGAINKQARAKRRKARVKTGNSCRVILLTTKCAPQIVWAAIKARYGKNTML